MKVDLICTHCGNDKLFELKEKNPHTGIYCKKCGNWIKWANNLEIKQLLQQKDDYVNLINFNFDSSNLKLMYSIGNENFYVITNAWFNEHNPKINVLKETYINNLESYIYSFGYFDLSMTFDESHFYRNNREFISMIEFMTNTKAIQ